MMIKATLAAPLALFCLTGCVATAVGTTGAVGLAAVQDRTVGEAVDDATASNEIKAKLLNERGFGEVDVEVANGLALLSGRVSTPEQRVRAEEIAWSSTRILDVANEIQIEAPGGWQANLADEWITARVRSALVRSSDVRSYNINIETYGGRVYLMGLARDRAEADAAAEEASYIAGVQEVISYIRIREPGRAVAAQTQAAPQQPAPYTDRTGSSAVYEDELAGGPGTR